MRVLLFTGKGGAGKTTTAAATAVHAARCGVKTLVLSTDAAHSLADALAVPLGPEPTEVEAGLCAQQLDGRQRLATSWGGVQEYLVELLDVLGVDRLAAEELTVLPGAEEVLALLEVRDQVRDGPWDLVVVDCAPTAETLRLLALPEALGWYLDRVLPSDRRVLRALRPVVARSSGLPVPGDPVLDAVGRLRSELADVRALLTAPTTSVRLVLTPESVVVAETRRALTSLALHGYAVDGVVANRVVPDDGDDPWRRSWARAQGEVLADVAAAFAPAPVLRAPYLPKEPVGVDQLADLAAQVYGPASAAGAADEDLLAVPEGPPLMRVQPAGEELVLELALPLADRSDTDLSRRGDDLVVSAGSARRVVALPSALRRCTVVGASLRAGVLAVRFAPDPAQWRPL